MNRARALVATAVTLAVGLATAVVTAPAQAEPVVGQGTLVVSLLDVHGQQTNGLLILVAPDGTTSEHTAVTGLETQLDPGSYGVLEFTPWGGIQCAGLDPCDMKQVGGGEVIPDGSVSVTEGATTTITLRSAPTGSITGTARVGKVVRLTLSPEMSAGLVYLWIYNPVVQWLLSGKVVRGAHDLKYTVTKADAGTRLAVRLTFPSVAAQQIEALTGPMKTSWTSAAVKVRSQ